MKLMISSIILFCNTSFLFAQESIPKAELNDTVKWKAHDFYIGGGAGNICWSLEFGYLTGGNIFGNIVTFWGIAISDRYDGNEEDDNSFIVESSIFTTFFDFKYNSGLGINIGLDFSMRKEIDKYSTIGSERDKLLVGPYAGVGFMFSKSKIGMKVLVGTIRQISFLVDFGI